MNSMVHLYIQRYCSTGTTHKKRRKHFETRHLLQIAFFLVGTKKINTGIDEWEKWTQSLSILAINKLTSVFFVKYRATKTR